MTPVTSSSKEGWPGVRSRASGNGPSGPAKGARPSQSATIWLFNVITSGMPAGSTPSERSRRISFRCTPVSRLMRLSVWAFGSGPSSWMATST